MKHPHTALERVASVTKDLLILETHVDLLNIDGPAMALYPGSELDDDPTNWCGPNHSAVEWMLRDVGFVSVQRVFERPRWQRLRRAAKLALKGKASFSSAYRQGRVVYHARKG
jgi:tRNA (mo5U34)-methyltransferase